MGKRRESDLRKISQLVSEMNTYLREHGPAGSREFMLSKRVQAQLIDRARRKNVSIDHIIEEMRPVLKKAIDNAAFTIDDISVH